MKNIKFQVILMVLVLLGITSFTLSGPPTVRELQVNGIKVIVKETAKDVISVRMFVRGGNANIPAENQGLENFAFQLAAEGGTKSQNKELFSTSCEKIGVEISGSSTYDYGTINLNCIKPYWNEAWNLFTQVINEPAFDQREFDLMKGTLITAAKQNESNPDQHLQNIAMESVYKGRSYSKQPEGTPATLEKLTLKDIQDHYNKAICKQRVFIVIVGNVNSDEIIEKIKSAFPNMPNGTASAIEPRVQITKPGVFIEDRDIATNYLIGIMSAPGMITEEGTNMRIGMNILYDRFFVELRTKRSLSYAPVASYNSSRISNPYNSIYISTKDPKASIDVMVEEINKIKKDGFQETELRDAKQFFLTRFYMGQETSSAQSQTIGLYELAGNWKQAESFTEDINKVALKDVNTTFTKYTGSIKWTYLGKKDAVTADDFKQTIKVDVLESPY